MSPTLQSTRSPISPSSQFLNQPTPPPLQHQPFSAPGNPYAGASAGLDKDFDEKVGLGMGVPMNVVEPRDKELPKEPIAMGRNRSGTGKSSKDKKSVFGVLSGELVSSQTTNEADGTELLTTNNNNSNKAPVISTPYDPIHLTHVGFDFNTGQCEWPLFFSLRTS